ncbi:NAD-dependent epimerase/dehydratase family protein [Rothia kristinae]|uniref:NAD-dependent epimerase/dehydratase family protein n=1 Tax=Rothia kristinae TaxID=37923 RepID=A0A7T4MT98_9MICC|nr:NAD-dependent epimerase/dehydratase family protein [Rothia kristinae]QQC59201.1 NAD-dependent epimerase/dehydratase family protein [Rothia kristinae]
MSVVVVTGGTGFLAGWTIRLLLDQGHTVRATVRQEAKGQAVVKMLAEEGVNTEKLSFATADLGSAAGWAEAVERADVVLHTASPLSGENHQDPSLVPMAEAGTRHVLDAAIAVGVGKVVMTSSAAAAYPSPADLGRTIDETYWTDPQDRRITQYMRSKVVAEKAAWELIARQSTTTLTTILPGAILGPFMGGRGSSTDRLFTSILRGAPSPKATYHAVDVRDLAALHLLAMADEQADGQRFLAQPGRITMPRMARLLKDSLGEQGRRVRTMTIPDVVIRLGARLSPTMAVMNTLIGPQPTCDATKASRLLGWQPRPVEDTVFDAADYLLDHGLVG